MVLLSSPDAHAHCSPTANLQPYKAVYTRCPSLIFRVNWQTYAAAASGQQQDLNTAFAAFGGAGDVAIGMSNQPGDFRGTGSNEAAVALMRANPSAKGIAV